VTLAAGKEVSTVDVAVDAADNSIAVWDRTQIGKQGVVQAAVMPAGGSWGSVTSLSEEAKGTFASGQLIAMDTAGEATVTWNLYKSAKTTVQAAVRPAGGSWSSVHNVSGTGEVSNSGLVVDGAGETTALWRNEVGGVSQFQSAAKPAGGSWGSAVPVSETGEAVSGARLAVDPAGDSIAVWQRFNPSGCTAVAGAGHYGENTVRDSLSTEEGASPILEVGVGGHSDTYRLTHLEGATCKAAAGGLQFSGKGSVTVGGHMGYHATFSFTEKEGGVQFAFTVYKGTTVVYSVSSEPLTPSTESIH
jgi:hypothetical protein